MLCYPILCYVALCYIMFYSITILLQHIILCYSLLYAINYCLLQNHVSLYYGNVKLLCVFDSYYIFFAFHCIISRCIVLNIMLCYVLYL